ncbi:thioredoxin-like associated protein 2 [Plasmodium gonderi]|uniref:Thioredoxin-like associated protein 2 n=1 Tax=Plasmodium gonderi TaxID=77519 RepID=A0A1Y1JHY1_PLAGO|nr:thioredoxin-like associated protein 2 [Plasmodium gonderi]GAW80043.1 thioredoxin-like associated protein 2 [Plasmodium gonderi]
MYRNHRTNHEYASPMVINVNSKQVNLPPINYNRYTSRNMNVSPIYSQSNLKSGEHLKNHVQYYLNGNDPERTPLKYNTSQNIPWRTDERQKTISVFNLTKQRDQKQTEINSMHAKQEEVKKIVRNYENSIRVPTNYSSSNSTRTKAFDIRAIEFAREAPPLKMDKNRIHFPQVENNPVPIRIQRETSNNIDILNKGEEYKNMHHMISKSNNYVMTRKKENMTVPSQMKKNDSMISSTFGNCTLSENIKNKSKIWGSTEFQRNDDEKFNKGEAHKNIEKVIEQKGEKKSNKTDEEIKNDKLRNFTKKNNDYKAGKDNMKKGKLFRDEKKIYLSSPHNNKNVQKNQFHKKLVTYKSNRETLPCNLSIDLKNDSLNLSKGLRIFQHMIVVDKNSVLKIWNGYEWKKVENYFQFVIKARYDNEGHIWCINHSYEILKRMKNKFKNFGNLANEEIMDISFDKKNVLWCVNRKGELLKWNRTKWNKIKYTGFHKLISLAFDRTGDLWAINTKRNLAIWCEKDNCWNEKIVKDDLKLCSLDFDNNGHIWVISTSGALLTYSRGNWMNFGYVSLDQLISVGFKKICKQ